MRSTTTRALAMAVGITAVLGFAACSDDDGDPNDGTPIPPATDDVTLPPDSAGG